MTIVRATRERKEVRLGGSPRASVALYRAAQAYAFLDGRAYVLPDDVKTVAPAILAHRIMLDLDYSLRGSNARDIVARVLEVVPAPPVDANGQPTAQQAAQSAT